MLERNVVPQWVSMLVLGCVIAVFGIVVAAEPVPPQDASGVKYDTNGSGIDFVLIPPGEFQMGCSEGAKPTECTDDERPRHMVQITKAFEIGKTEVTQKQWQAVMDSNPSFHKGDPELPVESVSFQDAQNFLSKLNARNDGFLYRLPTEAEWEYAARAGTTDQYAGALKDMAWYNDGGIGGSYRAFIGFEGQQIASTHPVATKKPNAWGIYDMRGNVAEWVQDWFDPSYYSTSSAVDPKGPTSGDARVVRGGSWHDPADLTRVSVRASFAEGYTFDNLGFRVAREKH